MGVVTNLSVTVARHEDGCVIMSWHYDSPVLKIGDQYCRRRETSFADMLDRLILWMDCVESGPTTSQELWEAMELPFD